MAVDAKEKNLVHARLRLIGRDAVTGEPKHKDFVQKYTVREWNALRPSTIGYEIIEEIHLPNGAKAKLEVKAAKPKATTKK